MAENEPKIENQEEDSPIEELKKRIEDIEMSLGVFNPRNMAGLRTKDLQQATRANLFGDGSDGDVVVSTEINLTRDMFYNNLTVEDGGIINTKSFRIFVKDQFIKKPGGILRNNGNAGADGEDGDDTGNNLNTGGAAGATVASGSLPGGIASGAGGKGGDGAISGTAGSDAAKSLGTAGSGGGGGGNAGGSGAGSGGSGGSQTGTLYNIIKSFSSAYYLIDTLPSIISLTISAGSGGGGGGDNSVTDDRAGGGGGAGSPAGMIWIAANRMFIEGENEIQCNGGAGGAGGDAIGTNAAGGGGGGAGGSGGVIILIYGDKTGTGTLSVAGGAGGAGGSGVAGGNNGSAGTAGQTGQTYEIQIQ